MVNSENGADDSSSVAQHHSIQFHLMDVSGRSWIIPCEIVETKMKFHQFVIHKSLSMQDANWVVSHYQTGGVVCDGESFENTVENARKIINSKTVKEFDAAVKRLNEMKREIQKNRRAQMVENLEL